jgi:hypothetical protein
MLLSAFHISKINIDDERIEKCDVLGKFFLNCNLLYA